MILIVDDRPETLDTYINVIEKKGIDWDYTETIDETVDFIQSNSNLIELCLIDLYMPGKSKIDYYQQFFEVTVNQGQSVGLFLCDHYPSINYCYLTNNEHAYSHPNGTYQNIIETVKNKSSTTPHEVIKLFDSFNIGRST